MVIYVIKSFFVHFFCVFLSPLFNFFLLMLGRWCFCPFLFLSLYKTFPWYLQFSLKRSLVFPILLFSSIYLHWLPRKTFFSLFAIFWNSSSVEYIFPFLLYLLLLFFSQRFVSPPQTNTLPSFISFSWGQFLLLTPIQCCEPPSIDFQALYQIYSLECNHYSSIV